jgi:hypothetical protein
MRGPICRRLFETEIWFGLKRGDKRGERKYYFFYLFVSFLSFGFAREAKNASKASKASKMETLEALEACFETNFYLSRHIAFVLHIEPDNAVLAGLIDLGSGGSFRNAERFGD